VRRLPKITVSDLNAMEKVGWPFRDSKPTWNHPKYPYYFSTSFDPFPGYPHDAGLVEEYAEVVTQRCPPLWDIDVFVADREEPARTNGWSQVREEREDEPALGVIMLLGKRIPPHPGMTRHLMGHEYGHHVGYMLGKARGARSVHDAPWLKDYIAMRGLPESANHHGEGGNWHSSVYEIFACDFRIAVCGIETEYWPHPGVPHPRELRGVLMPWWEKAVEDIKTKAVET
jgi:hypothetical protein